jgi:hypothetical protein
MIAGRIARSPDQTVGFWARRMALKTVVHRVDAEQARGAVAPVDAALGTDGIDEIFVIMLAGDWSGDPDDALNGRPWGSPPGRRAGRSRSSARPSRSESRIRRRSVRSGKCPERVPNPAAPTSSVCVVGSFMLPLLRCYRRSGIQTGSEARLIGGTR